MDKGRKLRRYTRKDYSQLVDFPVEIVGRDGVVRRYSFEESVRLYQRRIASANLRYADGEIVQAEVRHCEQRIAQLRKSYFTRFGWSAARVVDSPGMLAGEFAGEVVAFLRRVMDLPASDSGEPEGLELAFVEDEEHRQLYFVRHHEEEQRWLLYLYRFEGVSTSPARDSFFEFLKVLRGVQGGGDGVEHLVGFHHTADCGLVLTSADGSALPVPLDPPPERDWMELVDVGDDPLREGMMLLRKGRRASALKRFVAAYEQNHFRRAAYVGAVVVADQLGAHEEAETAAIMGSRYFPADAVLRYHLAIARIRRNSPGQQDAADALRGLGGPSVATALVDALVALRSGDGDDGRRHLADARAHASDDDADLQHAVAVLRARLAARDLARLGGAGLIAGGLALAWLGWLPGIGLSVAGAVLIPGAQALWRRELARLLEAPGATGLRLANPAGLRAATPAQPPVDADDGEE